MRPLNVPCEAHASLSIALHCILNIAPLVNYLLSSWLEDDLCKKRVNASAFTRGVASLARGYWLTSSLEPEHLKLPPEGDLDVTATLHFFRKIHRTSNTPPAVAVRQMYQVMQDGLLPTGNYMEALGGKWLVHAPDVRFDTVQKLVNASDISGLPHLIFIQLDRGNRTNRVIGYGTVLKVVKTLPQTISTTMYELVSVLMEGEDDMRIYAKQDNKWHYITAKDNVVTPVSNLNDLISTKTQLLAYLQRV